MRLLWFSAVIATFSLYAMEETKNIALHRAVRKGKIAIVKEWIKLGISVDVQDHYGHTPLHMAAVYNKTDCLFERKISLEIIKVLVAKKANLEIKDDWGDTPLSLAARKKNWAEACALLQAGASLNVANKEKNTPLHYLVYGGGDKQLELIICPRTMSDQERAIAKTLLLIHNRKDSLLGKLPKDLFLNYFLLRCCPNLNYVRGTKEQKVEWHIKQLKKLLLLPNWRGRTPNQKAIECRPEKKAVAELLNPEKVEQHRQLIESGYT